LKQQELENGEKEMETVREAMKKPVVLAGGGFLIGLILGWFVIGWGIWPVKWTDASFEHLRRDLKAEVLKMAVESYVLNKYAALAQTRFKAVGEEGEELLKEIESGAPQSAANIAAFRLAVLAGTPLAPATEVSGQVTPMAGTAMPGAQGLPTAEPEKKTSPLSVLKSVFLVLCIAMALIAVGLAVIFFLRSRKPKARPPQPAAAYPAAAPVEEGWEGQPAAVSGEEPPMMQFMASYKLGDDLFDDSFSIDSQSGEFLGECGVSISETIGVGDPKKVTAFEVWLFDKNDIQTITKVLMSEHAFYDEAIRQRLAAKGEPVLVQPGVETVLETQTLQLVVRVVEMGYGDGALPPSSYFEQLILELAVWSKA
jgi:hypothetical protein